MSNHPMARTIQVDQPNSSAFTCEGEKVRGGGYAINGEVIPADRLVDSGSRLIDRQGREAVIWKILDRKRK